MGAEEAFLSVSGQLLSVGCDGRISAGACLGIRQLRAFARLGLICEPRSVRFVSGHLRDLGLGESDGEQQARDEPPGNRFDGWLLCQRLDSRPTMDHHPEALFGDLELIAEDPMEEVIADLGVFIVRDLGPQASPVE